MRKVKELSRHDKLVLGVIVVAALVAMVGALFGWVHNIITLVQSTGLTWGELAVRIIGIPFVPIGVVMGYF